MKTIDYLQNLLIEKQSKRVTLNSIMDELNDEIEALNDAIKIIKHEYESEDDLR